jgi:hypothetical protein
MINIEEGTLASNCEGVGSIVTTEGTNFRHKSTMRCVGGLSVFNCAFDNDRRL